VSCNSRSSSSLETEANTSPSLWERETLKRFLKASGSVPNENCDASRSMEST
jgi:hypothetical protein